MDWIQLSQGYRATTRRQFPFYHSILRFPGVHGTQLVLNLGPLDWESSTLSTRPLHVSTFHHETSKSLLRSEALIPKNYFTKISSSAQALENLYPSADYWFCRLTLSTITLNCSMHGFPYWRDCGESPHLLKFCFFLSTRKNAPHQIFIPQTK